MLAPSARRDEIRRKALSLGFVRCGFAATDPLPHGDALRRWLDAGMAGEMEYMRRNHHKRTDPQALLPGARTAIVVAASYAAPDAASNKVHHEAVSQRSEGPGLGRIAAYAHGEDYHPLLQQRLATLAQWIEQQTDDTTECRAIVDTAPLLEREMAMAAGIGFIGKNTMLISPGIGSFTLLGTLLTTLKLPPDTAGVERCGTCTLCLEHCPTSAFAAPFVLDARRCISYLTIEHRADVPLDLQAKMGDWIFGCDDCQRVCPYNAPTPQTRSRKADAVLAPADRNDVVPLADLVALRSGAYRRLVRRRALRRTPRNHLRRNAAIAAGNSSANQELRELLAQAANDPKAVVATAAQQSLDRLADRVGDDP